MIEVGAKAPDFSLTDADGKAWTLKDFAGSSLVLYFYPRDDTPGCTVEACEFRDRGPEFAAKGVKVVGISPDSGASHDKFRRKHSLSFLLLSDPEMKTLQAYGAYGEKNMYGKKVMGVIRSTFVIDGSGTVAKVFPKVTPAGHADKVLESL
ncbi:MAG: thioredoxin-dependent thiol peroxidase [Spirochaetia bacterium]|jgi:peroxiredoxin Q/BCP|nr:thioredoxin-dependent thiol peroxidase [Spirochaetia bacterium]